MFELKRLSREAIPAALEKAQRYRLLNEPMEAQSICLDILAVEPANQRAIVLLLLASTDQFEVGRNDSLARAKAALAELVEPYARAYYAGIILERWARAQLRRGGIGLGAAVHDLLRQAMVKFEEAAALRPPGEDEALLRWNTCARLLMSRPGLAPSGPDSQEHMLE